MLRFMKLLIWLAIAVVLGNIGFPPEFLHAQTERQNNLLQDLKPENAYFLDLKNHWASPMVYGLAERNLLSKSSKFEPNQNITRAQLALILERVFPYQSNLRTAIAFDDVPANHWAAEAIKSAYIKGFLSGYPNSKLFLPDQKVTRLQAMMAIANGLNIPVNTKRDPNLFLASMYHGQDKNQLVPDYAIAAIAALTEQEIIVNYPDVRILNPQRAINKAELAGLIYQALVSTKQLPKLASDPNVSKYIVNPAAPLFDISRYGNQDLVTKLVVNLSRRQVTAYRGNTKVKTYAIGVGRAGWETPIGNYRVQQIIERPAWKNPFTGDVIKASDPENPLGGYWIGFWTNGKDWSGFHATAQRDSVGKASSHGCIRMYKEDIKELFAKVTPSTVVQVAH